MFPPAPFPAQMVLALLPRVFVGTYDRLQQLVEWACAEMRASFSGSGGGLPPWRSLAHMLNKWRLGGGQDKAEEEEGEEGSDSARRAVGSWPGVHVPSAAAAAFSAEQQQAMRMLLLQPVGAAVPAPHRGMTASSSCSSMDVVSAPPAPTPSPAGGLATPRSLLTQELSGLAASGGLKPQQAQGPAAAILSMALGSGRQAMQLDGSCA